MRIADVALLWGRAAGRCSAPDCGIQLTHEMPEAGRFIVGEHAHIIPRSPYGPRGDGRNAGSDAYENRILLCPTHHRMIDKAPHDYPRELLIRWKRDHELHVQNQAPAALIGPVVWEVPHRPNPHLAGRETTLLELAERLASRPVQVLHGLSGIGKTQLAVSFAHRHAADYRIVYWVDASPDAIEGDLRRLAADVGLHLEPEASSEAAQRVVRAFLAEREDYLLILDRAPDAEGVVAWLPERVSGHVVVTSTNPIWRRHGQPLELAPLDEPTGARYLEARTGHANGAALTGRLGGLPLALEQAASYVEATGVGLRRYEELFDANAIRLLGTEPRAEDYDATVLVTLSLAIEAIDVAEQPLALAALSCLSYVDASPFPRSAALCLLREAPGAAGMADEIGTDLALGSLAARSVVALNPSTVSVHALVSEVTRGSKVEDPAWVHGVQRGLRRALTGDAQSANSFDTYEPLVKHVIAACAHATRLGAANEDTARLLDRLATHFQQRGLYSQARGLFEDALAVDHGALNLHYLLRLNHSALVALIDAGEGLRLMHALLDEIGAEPTGEIELDTLRADLQQNLALALHDRGESEAARELNSRVRRIHDRVVAEKHRPESKNVIDAVNNDGLFAWATGDYEHALTAWNESLSLAEAAAQPDPLLVARSLSNLGVLFENLERPADSESHHRRALELRREHLPADHPDVINSLTALAGAHRSRGRLGHADSFACALTLDEEAEELAEGREDDLLIARALNGQALDVWLGGDPASALPRARRALQVRRGRLPSGHPDLLQALVNTGRISLEVGDSSGAAELFREALDQWSSSDLPPHHMQVALAREGLGKVAALRDDGDEACREFRRSLEAFTALLGPESGPARRTRQLVDRHC